ncbi:hypothetical protein B5E58_00465 [Tyzzerella sp. An114]|uniref:hypothetical protein n=1 Tax=Tyzzerella sp. An114 TaxID=1965545 RepID=UPI000B438659|nr:hypothetical protein [Tyzzerella sp. An114]OUQ60376.1 hypothetical protein B5E58_00465 [Tyzzerella sp. An114]
MQKDNIKHTFTVRLSEETANICAAGMAIDDCRSRNEFIEKAIKYYVGYLSADKDKLVLGEQIQKLVESSVKSSESRLSNQTFRIAVELAKLQRILSFYCQIDEETLTQLHRVCEKEVKNINGALSLEDIIRHEK